MFALTRKTDYGIIALCHMVHRPETLSTARDMAERYHVPPALLMNVLKDLCHAELVHSTRGVKGGYSLALPADQISLADIIVAVEGPIRFVQCAGEDGNGSAPCELFTVCPVSRPVRKVHEKLVDFLGQVTLAQIAQDFDHTERSAPVALGGVAIESEQMS